ncbi:MAG: GNAT family N-acetyltransferase [Gaiellaceae bacterium]
MWSGPHRGGRTHAASNVAQGSFRNTGPGEPLVTWPPARAKEGACDTQVVEPPPTLEVDDDFVLDGWRADDVPSQRWFAEDEDAARFFGWTIEQARAQPDSHYVAVVRRFRDEWAAGTRLSLAIRQRVTGRAVGAVELRPNAGTVEVSYLVAPDYRGQGLAPRALEVRARRRRAAFRAPFVGRRTAGAQGSFRNTGPGE